ncbi:Alanine racemase [Desulfovibrionales bacterium]
MAIGYNHIKVAVRLDAIRYNYKILKAAGGNIMPVVKADAYGHGLVAVGQALAEAGATALAVGTVEEAVQLRESSFGGNIVAMLGANDASEARAAREYDIIPFVFHRRQLELLTTTASGQYNGKRRLSIGLKFNTCMARLGFELYEAAKLVDTLSHFPAVRLDLVASHLAVADTYDDPDAMAFNRECSHRFMEAVGILRAAGHIVQASLANSAAILAWPELRLDIQRPGIALYGVNPFYGTSLAHLGQMLQPAMEVRAPVLQIHRLTKGATVSYGRTFTAPENMTIAVIAAGYADAYSWRLSSPKGTGGAVLLQGQRAPLLGRICMQMVMVDVSRLPEIQPGDQALLLGGEGIEAIHAEELASWWQTIPYEVVCLLGLNPRHYK